MRPRRVVLGLVAFVVVAAAGCTPPPPPGPLAAVAIDAGASHTCAVMDDATISCWGENYSRQLGPGSLVNSSVPVSVTGVSGALATAAGWSHSCALIDDGTARCWGRGDLGQLGNGSFLFTSSVPLTVAGMSGAVAIAAGGDHSCALIDDGTVRCWGRNQFGQLGDGTTSVLSRVPVTVTGLSGAVAIDADGHVSCALIDDGTVRCWGRNTSGQLGNGTTTPSRVPVTVTGLSGAVTIDAGSDHSCAAIDDGTARCWGDNFWGQLGDGTTNDSSLPVTVTGLNGTVAIAADGTIGHSCALIADGTARCWGGNYVGQLGDGTTNDSSLPVTVTGLNGAAAIDAGGDHACAVLEDDSARCWGKNLSGQLGDGTTNDSSLPVTVGAGS